jgi:hypothetical protein
MPWLSTIGKDMRVTMTQDEMAEKAKQRPSWYEQASPQRQWDIDKLLGLDWHGPYDESRTKPLLSRLSSASVAGCTCMTKTPVLRYHNPTCTYRVVTEAHDEIVKLQRDANLGNKLEGIIVMKSHNFTGKPPYVGDDGVVLALNETFNALKEVREENKRLASCLTNAELDNRAQAAELQLMKRRLENYEDR